MNTPAPRLIGLRHKQNRISVPIPRLPAAIFRQLAPTLNSRFSRFSPSARFSPGNSARSQEGAEERVRGSPLPWPRARNPSRAFKCTNSIPSALKPGLPQLPPPDLPRNGSLKDLKVDTFRLQDLESVRCCFSPLLSRSRVGNLRVCCLLWLG